jgi:hypothetical protein
MSARLINTIAQGEVGGLGIGARLVMDGSAATGAAGAKALLDEIVCCDGRETIIVSLLVGGGGIRSSNTTTTRSRRRLAERILTLYPLPARAPRKMPMAFIWPASKPSGAGSPTRPHRLRHSLRVPATICSGSRVAAVAPCHWRISTVWAAEPCDETASNTLPNRAPRSQCKTDLLVTIPDTHPWKGTIGHSTLAQLRRREAVLASISDGRLKPKG